MSNNIWNLCTPQKSEDINMVMFTKEKRTCLNMFSKEMIDGLCPGLPVSGGLVVCVWAPSTIMTFNVCIWKLILIHDEDEQSKVKKKKMSPKVKSFKSQASIVASGSLTALPQLWGPVSWGSSHLSSSQVNSHIFLPSFPRCLWEWLPSEPSYPATLFRMSLSNKKHEPHAFPTGGLMWGQSSLIGSR